MDLFSPALFGLLPRHDRWRRTSARAFFFFFFFCGNAQAKDRLWPELLASRPWNIVAENPPDHGRHRPHPPHELSLEAEMQRVGDRSAA